MNQRDMVLLRLRYGRDKGVCATRFLGWHIPRVAARVAELRGQGFGIVTEPCNDEAHGHRSRQIRYRLVTDGGNGAGTPADMVTRIGLDAGLDD